MRRFGMRLVISVIGVSLCSACSTSPGKTTAVSAATGGVLGAGLGAVVGSQTGDPGTGVAIGAVAGSSAGALVGNRIEGQEKDIDRQSELIRKQEAAIMSQRAELERLRQELGDDSFGELRAGYNPGIQEQDLPNGPSVKNPRPAERGLAYKRKLMAEQQVQQSSESRISGKNSEIKNRYDRRETVSGGSSEQDRGESSQVARARQTDRRPVSASHPSNRFPQMKPEPADKIVEKRAPVEFDRQEPEEQIAREVVVSQQDEPEKQQEPASKVDAEEEDTYVSPRLTARKSLQKETQPEVVPKVVSSAPGAVGKIEEDEQCSDARNEVKRADDSELSADKLFHLRRALRLCPNNVDFHLRLAQLYKTVGREGDSAYEFHEALRLDPENASARKGLQSLGSD